MRITPHPSHRIGTVDGQTRCVICWADPTWPISEQECDTAATTPAERAALMVGRKSSVRGQGMPWALIVLATSLRDEGMQWALIAERVGGYSMRAIQKAVLRHEKRGRQPRESRRKQRAMPTRKASAADVEAARARHAAGELITDIAESMGVPYESLRHQLRRDLEKLLDPQRGIEGI